MPSYSDNGYRVWIDSVEISGKLTNAKLSPSAETNENTRGNAAHKQRAVGLLDTKFDCTVSYDADQIILQSYIRKLKPGNKYVIEFAPQLAAGGTPRHVQEFIIKEAPFEIKISKSDVTFAMAFESADAPIIDMFDGGVY